MINRELEKELNKQVNAEMYSSYLYLSMSAYFQSKNLSGFASWMKAQALEELYHAMKFVNYIEERGGRVQYETIEQPPVEWRSPSEVFDQTYEHEQKVSGMINNLVNLAIEHKDHATNNFLQWFIAEQVEEESSADEVVQKLKLTGEKGEGLFMLDNEMAQRQFHVPTDVKLGILPSRVQGQA
jgi:ferritin